MVGSVNFNDEVNNGNFLKKILSNLRKFFLEKDGVIFKIVGLNLDKIYHFVQYFILASLLMFAAKNDLKKDFKFNLRLTFFIVFLIGMLDEIHQIFLKTRSCSLFDLFANLSGVFLLYLLFNFKKLRKDGI
uniref:VanZ-like domain-containing protein n=1 Tax=candidate division WOR-3 bacterium TaxID=2052148 RepID=A0A7C3N633_UNCW3